MTTAPIDHGGQLADALDSPLADTDLPRISELLTQADPDHVVTALERLSFRQRAVVYRLLPKDKALAVFESLDPQLQGDLVHALQDAQATSLFSELDPDDRVWLLDELPANLASKLLRGLSPRERQLTAAVLGYPQGSVGRRMTPEFVSTRHFLTVEETMARVRTRLDDAETVYVLPVLDHSRRVVGVVQLRDLLGAEPEASIGDLMQTARTAEAVEDAETAARRCTELGLLAMPVVDHESRLVGMLTIDDAVRILEFAESEDSARQGGVEPLRRPYLTTPIWSIVRSRIVWLLVLAVGATLTVQVLSAFEATLSQVTVLALFVPLLIGTGGNTGNQAATTVTRALALGDVRTRDILRVLGREVRVGLCLGAALGLLGFGITALAFDWHIGLVIGLTLAGVCTMAAAVGGAMPLAARAIRVDPAVFSNPFITTFVDASGLIVYFLIAQAVLGLG